MRIGTWNLEGRWKPEHEALLADANCDVWLLTEVNERVELPGYHQHFGDARMRPGCRWAGVYSRSHMTPVPDPHVASAAAVVDGVTYCATILPWKGAGGEPTWPGAEPPRNVHSGRMRYALEELLAGLPRTGLVWGGDWNQALYGPEWAGSKGGRAHVVAAVERLGLYVPTAGLPHRLEGHLSIDHIAVPHRCRVVAVERRTAVGLSDHDCYVIDVEPGAPSS
ncbi:endonuclease/exonuclease/phosphatase family protein [Modestobacter sp. VKM Ac-2985]|uniref:endonuclease/exonuclease/phosphatase family protein n=1 Tax=Modestobacter sp. VKM Ac-2985 TaxID=3004139 RepID=UPI0022ABB3FE|nr:endonuclease/exonuclease/phosphatase family protein [Modestobacter sp. VKM Ac-2985]MCZ2839932.1 hypothetical protein [Modestobacter sp. VKM Ac-2985]